MHSDIEEGCLNLNDLFNIFYWRITGWMYNKQARELYGWITNGRHRRSRDVPGEEESGREAVELMGRAGSFSWGGLGQIRGPGILGRSCGD